MSDATTPPSNPLRTPPGEQLKALASGLAMLIGTLVTALVTSGVQVEGWMIGLIVMLASVMAWLLVYYLPNRDGPHAERRREDERLARMTPAEAMEESERRRLTSPLPPPGPLDPRRPPNPPPPRPGGPPGRRFA
jgi:hypothetical protein